MGGTYDPETGQIVWEMHVPLAEQLAHYRAHPPRAIGGLRATPTEVEWMFDGHGEPVEAVFELACPCGSTRFTVTSGVSDDENCAPIAIECAVCEAMYEIFDEGDHGYDAEVNGVEAPEPETFDDLLSAEVEPPHGIIVRFEYPSDLLGDPEWSGREHDLFSWFTLLARDPATRRLAPLYEAECA